MKCLNYERMIVKKDREYLYSCFIEKLSMKKRQYLTTIYEIYGQAL